ncbi:hypothetical protein [Hymenobacter wooponensis]|uniref:Uncharacterized protein n=1 Tax=Hymenobacter wooponensis TaxID=1525360 RepID=A0A4Z0MG69_9BACT|nr:hypothetical protein [Hymenobacter wooponensis]TGD78524.1 hypothetical protein EU557_20710 [Hymenobacter wooponensis]
MAEEYAAKMSRKTDAELLLYLRNRAEYREEAVLAALNEAQQRQLPLEEFNPGALRAELEPIAAQQQAVEAQRLASIRQEEEETTDEPGPALYSPVTITLFSALFSLFAGGALLILNFRTLGRKGATSRLVLFLIGYLILFAILVRSLPQAAVAMLQLANLPPIIAYNLWFWPRYVGVQQYQRRGWGAPFIICMALSILLSMLLAPLLVQRFAEMGIPVK